MEYMPLLLRQFLGGGAPQLQPGEFKAYMLALAHIYENEGPVSDGTMQRHLGGRGWATAKQRLNDKGYLFPVPGGWMNGVALNTLKEYYAQQKRSETTGRKGGLTRAIKAKQRIRNEAALADLFEPEKQVSGIQTAYDAEKANEFNATGQGPLNHRARAHASEPLVSGSYTASKRLVNGIQTTYEGNLSNENKGTSQGPLNHIEEDIEVRDYPPVSPHDETDMEQPELVEGTVDDEFTVPRRKPGKPMPADWTPESAQLSEAVANMIAEWPPSEFERECTKFVEDAAAKDRRHVNWDRALGVWLTKHDGWMEERRKRNERPSGWAAR